MKNFLILMLFSNILCTSSACAETTNETDNETTHTVKTIEINNSERIELVCIDNYQFVIISGHHKAGIVQMFEQYNRSSAFIPKRCDK